MRFLIIFLIPHLFNGQDLTRHIAAPPQLSSPEAAQGTPNGAPPQAGSGGGTSTFAVRSVGASVGWEGDNQDHFLLVVGGEARIEAPRVSTGLEPNPRFTYHPLAVGYAVQLDINLLRDFELPSRAV